MGNSQNLKQSQQESQVQKIKMITQDTQTQSQTNQSLNPQNSFNEGEKKIIKQNFLLIQDELTQTTSIKPHQFNLTFEMKSLFQQVSISQKQKQKIPATIDVSTNGIPFKQFRGGIDMICIIDVSVSMKGEKIKLLKQTLLKLLDQLEEKDRLSLIVFNDKAEVLTTLKKMTSKNKLRFQKVIHDIAAIGGTNIYGALEKAMIQLAERKQLNPNTSLFLLSDGWDYQTKQKFQELFQDNMSYFTLNCFGFGTDHDPELLQNISTLFSGVYYNVTDIHQLEKYFLEALGHAMTSDGSQIEISVNCLANEIFQDEIEIQKIYSKKWNTIVAGKKYKIIIPLVGEASAKSFVFELQLPIPQKAIHEQQKDVAVLFASIQMVSPITNQTVVRQTSLILKVINNNDLNQTLDSNVAFIYYQTKCQEKIQKAEKFCQFSKYEDARNTLKKAIVQINSDDAVAAQCQKLIFDLSQAIIEVDNVEKGIYNHRKTYISNKQTQQIIEKNNEIEKKHYAQTSIQQNRFEQNNRKKLQDQYL